MKYILCDLDDKILQPIRLKLEGNSELIIIDSRKPIAKCVGCFKCWLKHPGECVFDDDMKYIGSKLMRSDEIIIVCDMLYGGFSVNTKRIIDRVIPGVLPFFQKINNELHHYQRFNNNPKLKVIFTNKDNLSRREIDHSRRLVGAVSVNFHCCENEIAYTNGSIKELMEEI